MIERKQLYILDYYKKNTYMGSEGPLNYRIHRVEVDNPEKKEADSGADEKTSLLEAICWPGPFIYDRTKDELKKSKRFPYTEEGMNELIDWLMDESRALGDKRPLMDYMDQLKPEEEDEG